MKNKEKNPLKLLLTVVIAAGTILLVQTSFAISYTFKTIDVPGALGTATFDINDTGQIAGLYQDATTQHGFLYTGGAFTTLDPPDSTLTQARGINSSGQITGAFNKAIGTYSFLYTAGSFTTVAIPWVKLATAEGINDAGDIVGIVIDAAGQHGFIYTSGGVLTIIDMPGAIYTDAFGINDAGQVVGLYNDTTGTHGLLYRTGTLQAFDVPGALYTDVRDVNNAGQIVGRFQDAAGMMHGYTELGGVLSQLDMPGGWWTEALGINNAGEIVGMYIDADFHMHGFIAIPQYDTTPPDITPIVTGTVGLNGWYTSAVTVAWNVQDDESPITARSGCDSTMLTTDTADATLTCSATSAGGTASKMVTIKIDATPPVIACAVAPTTLWPPDHKLSTVRATVNVSDALSGTNGFTLASVTSSEPDSGLGGGDIQQWDVGTPDVNGLLRAERFGNEHGRVYTLTYRATDAAGNNARCDAEVSVPRSRHD